ncbi:hypothetical protein AVP41_00792 [Microbacterium sp. TNHR37B]|nr:hypothetical protein AVP41_00792 [Microbacterium sp. TNHR37B]
MLRLDPSHPPLWRTPSDLQFGVDDVARLRDVRPWQERVLAALEGGVPDGRLVGLARSFGASPSEAEEFVRAIRPALTHDSGEERPASLEFPGDFPVADANLVQETLERCGVELADVRRWPDTSRAPLIIVAHHLVDPGHAARLMADGVPHLPIVLAGAHAVVGPLILPGLTACLSCLAAHHRDRDPQWPLLVSQLLGRPAPPTSRAVLVDAATLAGRFLHGAVRPGVSVAVSAASVRRRWRVHHPHAMCLCRSPEGNGSVDAPAPRSPAPTTARGFARPA